MKSQKDSLEIALSDKDENMDMCTTHCIVVEVLTKQHSKKRMVILMDQEDHWNDVVYPHGQIEAIVSCTNSDQLEAIGKIDLGHKINVYKVEDKQLRDLEYGYYPRVYKNKGNYSGGL